MDRRDFMKASALGVAAAAVGSAGATAEAAMPSRAARQRRTPA